MMMTTRLKMVCTCEKNQDMEPQGTEVCLSVAYDRQLRAPMKM